MNQILGITLKLLRSRRFSILVALAGLGLLFTTSGARAGGCAVPYKAGAAPAIPFVSPHADEESKEHATIVGLWHVIYTATYDDNFPPGGPFPPTPFQFVESFKTWHADGTEFENALLPPAGGICYGVWKELVVDPSPLGFHRALSLGLGLIQTFHPNASRPLYLLPPTFSTMTV